MERMTAVLPKAGSCSVCGVRKAADETWFLITENTWDDRLDIWRWHRPFALEASVHSLCSPRHVREMVVHWMTTGCLAYPFASMPAAGLLKTAPANQRDETARPMLQHIGEFSVDRVGILHALRENPLSLNIILDELMIVLEQEGKEDAETDFEDEPYFALRTV
jgi:hypothetical protein